MLSIANVELAGFQVTKSICVHNDFSFNQRSSVSGWVKSSLVKGEHVFFSAVGGQIDFRLNPIFIVGCGNTGTTLLASRLGNHPDTVLLPAETGIFLRRISKSKFQVSRWLDRCDADSASFLIEKTPKHIQRLRFLSSSIRRAKIIVTTRNALDNIASLKSRLGRFDLSVERWCSDNSEFLKYADRNNIHQVRFEELTDDPETVLRRICEFCELSWSEEILEASVSSYAKNDSSTNLAIRKQQIQQEIVRSPKKWDRVLSKTEVAEVVRKCGAINRRLGYESTA